MRGFHPLKWNVEWQNLYITVKCVRRNYLKSPTWTCKEDTIKPFVFSGSLMVRGNWDHEAMSWWADENGTCTGIVLAYPFSFPWHIQFRCISCSIKVLSIELLWQLEHEVLMEGKQMWGLRITGQSSLGRKKHANVCILLFCQRRIALPFTYTHLRISCNNCAYI
jgi:hypothetical protein